MTLRRSPLYDLSAAAKARFVPFAGWEMAVQYSGLKAEHQAVREAVGMFDISHMGKFALAGENLVAALQPLVPSDLARLAVGEAQYTVLLNDQAGIIDDVIYYHQGDRQGFLIVNAATTEKDWAWLTKHLTEKGIQLTDLSREKVLIAVQGCKAENTLQPFFTNLDLSSLKFFDHATTEMGEETVFIARTGYTGEDGFEVMLSPELGQTFWQKLIEKNVIPCGLGSRDTLRLEAALHLYGQDMNDETTPLEAGLGWLIHWQTKGDFIGKEILLKQKENGVEKKLVGLAMQDRGIARHDYPILVDNQQIGIVTSGTMSPTLNQAIALAYLPREYAKIGQTLDIDIRGKLYPAKVVKKPFYRSPHR